VTPRLQELKNTAHTLGLKLVELGLFEREHQRGWRLDSRLSGACLPYCTSIDGLEAQLDLFASTSKAARDLWLLGVGVSDEGAA
jgi:DNA-binding IclR family transcriptional regulator